MICASRIGMLRCLYGVTREDSIKDKYIRGSIDVALILEKIKENKLS